MSKTTALLSQRSTAAPPTALDLFSGCGGLTLGLKRAGFSVRAAVEIDPLAVKTYVANHPEVAVSEKDIRDVDPTVLLRSAGLSGPPDLLAGCPPCEGFSRLRTRNRKHKVDDLRNDLVLEFLRFVEELQPRAVMLENVPDLKLDIRFLKLCTRLEQLGYQWEYRVLDAADYGVPQRRRRLILLARLNGPVIFPPPSGVKVLVRDVLRRLGPAGRSGDPVHDAVMRHTPRILNLIRRIPKNGGGRTALPRRQQLACHQKCDGFKDVYGRMRWNDVAPTITGGCVNPSKGRFLHPERDRVITLREAAVLQSFPRDYIFCMDRGRYAAAELIGNALPPEMIRRIARPLFWSLFEDRFPQAAGRRSTDRAAGSTASA